MSNNRNDGRADRLSEPWLWNDPIRLDGTIDMFLRIHDEIAEAISDYTRADPRTQAANSKALSASILGLLVESMEVKMIYLYVDRSVPCVVQEIEIDVSRRLTHKFAGAGSSAPAWANEQNIRRLDVVTHSHGSGILGRLYVDLAIRNDLDLVKVRLVESLFRMYVQGVYEVQVRARLSNAVSALFRNIQNETRFASIISEATGSLSKAIRADACYFVSMNGCIAKKTHGAFRHNSRAKALENESPTQISDRLRLTLSGGEPFYWSDETDMGALLTSQSESAADRSGLCPKYLFVPVSSDADVIGCLLAITKGGRPTITSEHFGKLISWSELMSKPSVFLFQRNFNKLIVDPIFKSRNTRVDVGTCCVLMPFHEAWSDRIWQRVVLPTLNDLNLKGVRADDLFGHDVMEDIWEMINRSEYVIADITGRNANVFYELGIAHALGKKVILMTQRTNDIPFDLNRYRHIFYEDNLDGAELLRRQLIQKMSDIAK